MRRNVNGSITICTILNITKKRGEGGWTHTQKLAPLKSVETEESFYKEIMRD